MQSIVSNRFAAALRFAGVSLCVSCFLSGAPTLAQTKQPVAADQPVSSLPATAPTTQPALAPSRQEPKHAQVAYTNGVLSVNANDASLNQILRQISRETGMKITGGVAEERVFGQYGPALPSQVLATLLDGTGSNMLLVHRQGNTPAELVLTPRMGGPSPPNPNAAVFNERAEPEEPHESVSSSPSPQAGPNQSAPVEVTPYPGAASPNGAASGDAQPQSPNGVKTPQQIYEQLQRLRQQPAAPQ